MKRQLYRLLLFVLLLNLLLFALPHPAHACSCVEPGPPADAFTQSAAVFTGRVTSFSNIPQIPFITPLLARSGLYINDPFYSRRATLAVTHSWKGVTTTQATILTGQGDADCGYGFQTGKEYLIYAYQTGNNLATNICTRTAPTTAASTAEDLTYLTTQPTLALTTATRSPIPYIAIPLLLIPLALAAVWYIRRKRKTHPAA